MTLPAHQVRGLTDLIAAEIRLLRKGRGIQTADLDRRLGPYLRELSSVPHEADIAARREVLVAELTACAQQLTPDLRAAIDASLGLSARTSQVSKFTDRAHDLATSLDRDYRTALRRIDSAEQLLAEEVARELRRRRGRTATTPVGWYLDEFSVLLRLDTPAPESYEQRRIVATRADLTEVVAWFDVPRTPGAPPPELEGEVTQGGRLVRRAHPSGDKFQFVVALPVPLQPSESHTYGLRLRMSALEDMSPHYIFTPECRCNAFDLRVRFDMSRPPEWVRRVEAETVRTFDSAQSAEDLLTPDAAGEVHVRFHHPTMYLGYGIQWKP